MFNIPKQATWTSLQNIYLHKTTIDGYQTVLYSSPALYDFTFHTTNNLNNTIEVY